MKILFLTLTGLADFTQQHLAADLPRYFADNGHEVWVLAQTDRGDGGLREEAGCRVIRVDVGSTEKVGAVKKFMRVTALDDRSIRALKKYAKGVRFDCVVPIVSHLAYYRATRYAVRRDNAFCYMLLKDIFPYNTLDMGMLRESGWRGMVYRAFRRKEKKYYALCDKIGCISPANQLFLKKICPYLPDAKLEVNPNSISVRDRVFTDEELREIRMRFSLPDDKKIFVYGGNLGKPQGVDFLIECLTENRRSDVHFAVVGSGTEYAKLKGVIAEQKLENVTLIPLLPQDEFHKILRISYAGLAFLSPKFTMPNYPSRTLAYLEERLSIVFAVDRACDAGLIAEENGYGFNVISGDKAGFFAAIDALADSPARAEEMGARGRTYLEQNYTVDTSYNLIIQAMTEDRK